MAGEPRSWQVNAVVLAEDSGFTPKEFTEINGVRVLLAGEPNGVWDRAICREGDLDSKAGDPEGAFLGTSLARS